MKVLWMVLKVAIALMLIVPVSLIILGVVGTVLALAVALLRFALIGLLAYGAFKLVVRLRRGGPKPVAKKEAPQLGAADPYYQAAMRELDRDIA